MAPTTDVCRIRRGFTLVEMLTVVIIIGLLASMLLVAFGAARRSARNATVKSEITQLDIALENYRQEFGEYPPDFVGCEDIQPDPIRISARTAIIRHLRKRFPRMSIPAGTIDDQYNAFVAAVASATSGAIDVKKMTPPEALVFWLGGLPASATSTELIGFSANARNPFDTSPTTSRTEPLFEFQTSRLQKGPSGGLMYGAFASGQQLLPYFYFRPVGIPGDNNNWYWVALQSGPRIPWPVPNNRYPYPYCQGQPAGWDQRYQGMVWVLCEGQAVVVYPSTSGDDAQPKWLGAGKPQIIWSGQDGEYCRLHVPPPPEPPRCLHCEDNIASFTENATLGDEK